MPSARQIAENRFMTLDRLLTGDRIVWQHADGECWPSAVWWENGPQLRWPKLWLSTCHYLRDRKLITEGLRPRDSNYRTLESVTLYVATPAAEDAFINFAHPVLREKSVKPAPDQGKINANSMR
jgi:hypothetical protein